jgi:hypothetical protein
MLGVGYSEELGPACWTFPERNSRGWIIGIQRRMLAPSTDGRSKLCCKGSRRGLSYCDGWDKYPGAIWLVEGGSDVAAALTLRLCVIGRPSNTGGIQMLVEMLRKHGKRKIIVTAENDRKSKLHSLETGHDPKCRGCLVCWPGRAGAIQTAVALAAKLDRQVGWKLPPRGFKDLREYIRSIPEGERGRYAEALQNGRLASAGA